MNLWLDPAVPKTGWHCTGITDLGAPDTLCGMCNQRKIRYVHYLSHPQHDSILRTGCICAAKLETEQCYAKDRERFLKSRAKKRANLFDRDWRTTFNGNPKLTDTGYQIILFHKPPKYGWLVVSPHQTKQFAAHWPTSEVRAALEAFDYVTKQLSHELLRQHGVGRDGGNLGN